MKNKSLFFDFKRGLVINILIIIQIMFWVFYIGSFISIINFKTTFIKRMDKYYPMENGAIISFEKLIMGKNMDENQDKIFEVLDNNNIEYEVVKDNYQREDTIDMSLFSKDMNTFNSNYREDEFPYKVIEPNTANYTFIKNKNKYIEGTISEDDWQINENEIPIILGSNLRKLYNIGDRIVYEGNSEKYKGKIFEVKGFFKKDVMFSTSASPTISSQITNGKIFMPIPKEDLITNINFDPIMVYLRGENLQNEILNLKDQLNNVNSDISVNSFYEDLNGFLDEIKVNITYEKIRLGIISFIIASSIITSIGYVINTSRDRIGILYALGGSKKYIFNKALEEFMFIALIGCLLGEIFYLKEGKQVYTLFINENIGFNLLISTILLVFTILLVVLVSLRKINKLSPRELIGGFVE